MRKFWDTLKAIGIFVYLGAFLAVGVIDIIGAIFPAAIPGWMYAAGALITAPFWVVCLVTAIREGRKRRRAKREGEKISEKPSP